MLKVGIWGCGGISAMHRRAYQTLRERGVAVQVVALCDINPLNFNREIKINVSKDTDPPLEKIDNCYTDIDEMLNNESLDLVDICLPTFLHKDAAIKVLDRGINVLVEKPMAMTYADAREMLEAKKRSGKQLMVGHCVRFIKTHSSMREAINGGEYGKLISADFSRLSAVPIWRIEKGGKNKGRLDSVILDLHIHDIDYVQCLFGMPKAISAVVSKNNFTYCDSVSTTFIYDDSYVHINGDWGLPQSFAFNVPFRINLEKAALVGNEGDDIYIHSDVEDATIAFPKDEETDIMREIEYYVDLLINGKENTVNPPEHSADTMRLVEIIEQSANENGKIIYL